MSEMNPENSSDGYQSQEAFESSVSPASSMPGKSIPACCGRCPVLKHTERVLRESGKSVQHWTELAWESLDDAQANGSVGLGGVGSFPPRRAELGYRFRDDVRKAYDLMVKIAQDPDGACPGAQPGTHGRGAVIDGISRVVDTALGLRRTCPNPDFDSVAQSGSILAPYLLENGGWHPDGAQ